MFNGVPPRLSELAELKPWLSRSSVNLANLEIPLTDVGRPTSRKRKEDLRARRQFVLRARPEHAAEIKAVGFNGVSLGNNHAMDYGPEGLDRMELALEKAGLGWAGAGSNQAGAMRVTVRTLPTGFRVGLISALAFATPKALQTCTPATQTSAGINAFDPKTAADWIRTAHKKCDFLIVALHGGVERRPVPTGTQHLFARLCIDAGADMVWGHHPHVLEGAELYKGHPILYSMGNLVSSLGGPTALIQLHFEGVNLKATDFIPCQIAGGDVHVLPPNLWPGRLADWNRLCKRAATKDERPLPAHTPSL